MVWIKLELSVAFALERWRKQYNLLQFLFTPFTFCLYKFVYVF